MLRCLFVAVLVTTAAGCGLISSDVGDFDLTLPEKRFTVDSAQWDLTGDATFPTIPCAGMETVCSAAVMEACGDETCFGTCDGTNCRATIVVGLWTGVNLLDEKPELQTIDEQPLIDVTIDDITYTIEDNTLNVATPELTIYVAPITVMSPGSPSAREVGTIASIPAGAEVSGKVNLSPEGRADLREFMNDFRTPFNIIVGTEIDIQAGDAVPNGRLDAVVNVSAHAGL